MLLPTTETRRALRELFFCPIGRRRSGKRSQPFGHDLVHRWLHVNGWRQDKELAPQAEALFPGRRLPAREKSPSSVSSVPLWFIFNQASSGRHSAEQSDESFSIFIFKARRSQNSFGELLLYSYIPSASPGRGRSWRFTGV